VRESTNSVHNPIAFQARPSAEVGVATFESSEEPFGMEKGARLLLKAEASSVDEVDE
jgi:hypothetical protein